MSDQIDGYLMPASISAWAFYISNLGIVAGYLTASLLISRRKAIAGQLSWRAWIAGVAFFLLCGLTHIELALHAFFNQRIFDDDGTVEVHMLWIHVFQVFSIWAFLWAMATEPGRHPRAPLEGAPLDTDAS